MAFNNIVTVDRYWVTGIKKGAATRFHHPASVVMDKSHGMELLVGIHCKFVEHKHRLSLNLALAAEQVVPAACFCLPVSGGCKGALGACLE